MRKLSGIIAVLAVATLAAAALWAQVGGANPVEAPGTALAAAFDATSSAPAPPDTTAEKEEEPQVELKMDTAFAYVALEMKGSYDQHEAAFTRLYEEAMNQGIYGGLPFGVYWNSPGDTPVEQLRWDVGFAAPSGEAPKAPLTLKKWDFTKMASLKYRGVFGGAEMEHAYERVYQWIAENGYQPAGPMMEVFLNTPSPDENGVLYGSVEVIVPVKQAEPAEGAK
jgi:AraC family transcriptional regulator